MRLSEFFTGIILFALSILMLMNLSNSKTIKEMALENQRLTSNIVMLEGEIDAATENLNSLIQMNKDMEVIEKTIIQEYEDKLKAVDDSKEKVVELIIKEEVRYKEATVKPTIPPAPEIYIAWELYEEVSRT